RGLGVLYKRKEEGRNVVSCAGARKLTMKRDGIRRLVAEELQLPSSTYRFADSENFFREACAVIGYPCIVKPVMSSSGKGQTFI
ncbi:ATP-grasp domain-containing protein, partial [Escherichia coli]|uniref:ATP-grasp domain-containing protein n=1 Tax=Escherichia coli TaxID=562 RepID=UPI00193A752E